MTAKHLFLMNSLPNTNDLTHGFFRKVLIIPFNYTVKPEEIDNELLPKLLEELPGIFNWAFEGYKRLAANDYLFSESSAVEKVKGEYINRENPTGLFFHDNFDVCPEQRVRKSDIYRSYMTWCESNGLVPMNRNKFYYALSLKAEEDKTIVLKYKRNQGINYLDGYKKKENN